MHVPDKWRIEDREQIHQFINNHSFATLVSSSLEASRLPLYLDQESNLLLGHFARSNKHWKEVEGEQCLAIFDGAHDYISPTWYKNHPAVPTWNYASIHIKGRVSLLGPAETHRALTLLLEKYEPALLKQRDIVTKEYQEKLSKGIVGFSMSIDSIEAKAKLGQHRPQEDQLGVVQGLNESKSPSSNALLALMRELDLGLGNN